MNQVTSAVESRTIDFVPESERHGRPRSLFFVWFAANTSITALVTGALFVVLGNSALWSLPAILIGNAVGGFFTALHSAQGPKLGLPQMIQSRAQFGVFGAVLPLVLALIIYIGFYATGLVLGGQAMGRLLHVDDHLGAALFAVFSTALAIFGYRRIHEFAHVASVLSAVVFIGLIVRLIAGDDAGDYLTLGSFAGAPFVLGVSLAASWQLTFGPYIADYSRYLPKSTPQKSTIGWTFAGSVLGGSLAMTIGAFVAARGGEAFESAPVGYLADLGGPLATVVLLAVICGKLTGNTLSSYGGYMSIATILTTFTKQARVTTAVRIGMVVGVSLVSLAIALAASDDFIGNFTDFLLFLLYFMTPWSAVNLADYYLVRHGRYSIPDLFDPDGRYGRVNSGAYVAYLVGVAIQIPFMNSSVFVGPIASWMGGAEVAWLIGLVVSGGLYYLFARRRGLVTAPDPEPAIPNRDGVLR